MNMYVLSFVRTAPRVTPIMIEQGVLAFENLTSMNTVEPHAPYPMSRLRDALYAFGKAFGHRYGRHNMLINSRMPDVCDYGNLSPAAQHSIPANRPAMFSEIGGIRAFLASKGAAQVNGPHHLKDDRMAPAVR